MLLRGTLLLILSLASGMALAKPSDKNKPSSETLEIEREREFAIPVPQSEIKLAPLRYVAPRPMELAVGVSTWVPENLTRSSYNGKVSRFEKDNLPSLSLNGLAEIASLDNGLRVSSKLGISYFTMDRQTSRTVAGSSAGNSVQTLSFLMARAGVESSWSGVMPWHLEPSLSFSLLPTFLSSHQSQFEDSLSVFGVPYEATGGFLWRSDTARASEFGDLSVGIFGHAVSGSVAGSSLKGFGILGELRVSL